MALIGLIAIDVFRVYGSPLAMVRAAFDSVAWLLGGRREMTSAA